MRLSSSYADDREAGLPAGQIGEAAHAAVLRRRRRTARRADTRQQCIHNTYWVVRPPWSSFRGIASGETRKSRRHLREPEPSDLVAEERRNCARLRRTAASRSMRGHPSRTPCSRRLIRMRSAVCFDGVERGWIPGSRGRRPGRRSAENGIKGKKSVKCLGRSTIRLRTMHAA